jgi:hypothetical protein
MHLLHKAIVVPHPALLRSRVIEEFPFIEFFTGDLSPFRKATD